MSPLHLGLVGKSLVKSRGGHEKYLGRLVNKCLDEGIRLTIFCESADEEFKQPPDIDLVNVPVFRFEQGLRRWSFNFAARHLVDRRRDELDLVFTTGKVNFGDLHRAGGGVHKRYLQECGGPWAYLRPKNWVELRLQRQLYERNDHTEFVVNSNMVKKQVIGEFGVDESNIHVVYNGVDTNRFHYPTLRDQKGELREKHGFDRSDFLCLFTGAKWKRKGLPELLDAIKQIQNENVKLIVVGNVKEHKLQKRISSLGIQRRVIHAGYTDAIEEFYALSDLFVFPSRYDAGANVVIEALACGLPVITTRTNGTHELIEENNTGIVLPRPTRTEDIRDGIVHYQNRHPYPDLRERAFKTGRKFTMDRHFRRMLTLFQSSSQTVRKSSRGTSNAGAT